MTMRKPRRNPRWWQDPDHGRRLDRALTLLHRRAIQDIAAAEKEGRTEEIERLSRRRDMLSGLIGYRLNQEKAERERAWRDASRLCGARHDGAIRTAGFLLRSGRNRQRPEVRRHDGW
jgi:hypothetical protein